MRQELRVDFKRVVCREPVEGWERATCVHKAIRESRVRYVCAESQLMVESERVVCQEFKSKQVVSRQQDEGQGQATSVLRPESKPAVCQEPAEGRGAAICVHRVD